MKIGVISDTHGSIGRTKEALNNIKDLDLVIHLGDYVKDARELEKLLDIEIIYVRGNCDFLDSDVEDEKILEIENKKILITHGHRYDVKDGVSKIFYKGKEENVDIVLFGHSHMSTKVESEGIILLNPGSATEPRNGSKASIGLINLKKSIIETEIIKI